MKYNLTNPQQDAVSIKFIPTSQHEGHRYDVKDWKGNIGNIKYILPVTILFTSIGEITTI